LNDSDTLASIGADAVNAILDYVHGIEEHIPNVNWNKISKWYDGVCAMLGEQLSQASATSAIRPVDQLNQPPEGTIISVLKIPRDNGNGSFEIAAARLQQPAITGSSISINRTDLKRLLGFDTVLYIDISFSEQLVGYPLIMVCPAIGHSNCKQFNCNLPFDMHNVIASMLQTNLTTGFYADIGYIYTDVLLLNVEGKIITKTMVNLIVLFLHGVFDAFGEENTNELVTQHIQRYRHWFGLESADNEDNVTYYEQSEVKLNEHDEVVGNNAPVRQLQDDQSGHQYRVVHGIIIPAIDELPLREFVWDPSTESFHAAFSRRICIGGHPSCTYVNCTPLSEGMNRFIGLYRSDIAGSGQFNRRATLFAHGKGYCNQPIYGDAFITEWIDDVVDECTFYLNYTLPLFNRVLQTNSEHNHTISTSIVRRFGNTDQFSYMNLVSLNTQLTVVTSGHVNEQALVWPIIESVLDCFITVGGLKGRVVLFYTVLNSELKLKYLCISISGKAVATTLSTWRNKISELKLFQQADFVWDITTHVPDRNPTPSLSLNSTEKLIYFKDFDVMNMDTVDGFGILPLFARFLHVTCSPYVTNSVANLLVGDEPINVIHRSFQFTEEILECFKSIAKLISNSNFEAECKTRIEQDEILKLCYGRYDQIGITPYVFLIQTAFWYERFNFSPGISEYLYLQSETSTHLLNNRYTYKYVLQRYLDISQHKLALSSKLLFDATYRRLQQNDIDLASLQMYSKLNRIWQCLSDWKSDTGIALSTYDLAQMLSHCAETNLLHWLEIQKHSNASPLKMDGIHDFFSVHLKKPNGEKSNLYSLNYNESNVTHNYNCIKPLCINCRHIFEPQLASLWKSGTAGPTDRERFQFTSYSTTATSIPRPTRLATVPRLVDPPPVPTTALVPAVNENQIEQLPYFDAAAHAQYHHYNKQPG
jgi:hypothetical protein